MLQWELLKVNSWLVPDEMVGCHQLHTDRPNLLTNQLFIANINISK
jgi:hypothetical protein